jgi:hypothetical protein
MGATTVGRDIVSAAGVAVVTSACAKTGVGCNDGVGDGMPVGNDAGVLEGKVVAGGRVAAMVGVFAGGVFVADSKETGVGVRSDSTGVTTAAAGAWSDSDIFTVSSFELAFHS